MNTTTVLRSRSINMMRWSEYSLTETGIKVREKDLSGIRETTIPYDRLGFEATYFLRHSAVAKLGIILFLIISIVTGTVYALHGDAEKLAWVFWLGATAFTFIYYANTKREGFRMASAFGAVIVSGKRDEVEEFIPILLNRKMESILYNMRDRLANMDRIDVAKYLVGLRDGGVLNQEQYEDVRRKSGMETEPKSKVGFAS